MDSDIRTDGQIRTDELMRLRQRRAELRETMGALELALAAPASGRAVVWGEVVHDALTLLANDFAQHIAVTEGPGGLHASILSGDLRLSNAVAALATEHVLIGEQIAELVVNTEPPVTLTDVPEVRVRATSLIARLARHRQRGADLIYEAFDTDIGGGD